MDEYSRNKYLIIGGAPKSGTTSLFRYLSNHPDVCPANRKETYFFAREFDSKKVCVLGESVLDLETYYSHCNPNTNLRLEATPYTLYAKGAAKKIATMLPNSSMLFILRDPINRLISDYRFIIQRNRLAKRRTFKDFVEWQLHMRRDIPNNLRFGCYLEYLQSFIEAFGRRRILILFFEDFFAQPIVEMGKLCERLGIDMPFYQTYVFHTHNPTINFKSTWFHEKYMSLELAVAALRARIIHIPVLHRVFEETMMVGKITYGKLNRQRKGRREIIPNEVIASLKDYYRPHNDALSKELGRALPWDSHQDE